MRILLIGGSGVVGRSVLQALQQQGHTLAAFHRGKSVGLEDAIRETVRWELNNPPSESLLPPFDYAAEDAALVAARLSAGRTPITVPPLKLVVRLILLLGAFTLPFAGVLRIFAGLRKIRICIFQHWVLITVSQLSLQADVSGNLVIFGFHRALLQILVHFFMCHECDLCQDLRDRCEPAPQLGSLFVTGIE